MKTFEELLEEENINFTGETFRLVERAAIRFVNQQTADLQARILHFRRLRCVTEEDFKNYDDFFGISTDRTNEE